VRVEVVRIIDVRQYTTGVETMPKLATALGVSGNEHYFMRFGKHAFAADGEHMNTFGPGGLSGGALLDLGDFSSPGDCQKFCALSRLIND
jgi:hypothetical protein